MVPVFRRFIPARAGNAEIIAGKTELASVHPRACGERLGAHCDNDSTGRLSALSALTAGSNLPPMLAPAATRHRRPDPPSIEGIKGRLAAIMEFRQQAGLSRKAASDWVVAWSMSA